MKIWKNQSGVSDGVWKLGRSALRPKCALGPLFDSGSGSFDDGGGVSADGDGAVFGALPSGDGSADGGAHRENGG